MQNAPTGDSQTRLPMRLIRLCQRLWIGFVLVLASSVVLDIIIGVISSATYDLIKEFLLQNILIGVLCLVCLALFGALVYVISVHPSSGNTDSTVQQPQRRSPSFVLKLTYIVLPLLLVVSAAWYFTPIHAHFFPPDTGLGVAFQGANAAPVGLCDGTCAIDINRLDGKLKQEAADQIKLHNNNDRSCEYWTWASQEDTADAEAKIDIENHCVTTAVKNYIDLAVVVQLADRNNGYLNGMSRNILQGAYLVQKEYNDAHPEGPQIYLFIANIGDPNNMNPGVQQQVAQQILHANVQTADPGVTHRIVGVVGLPFGSDGVMQVLKQQDIPMVSVAPPDPLVRTAYLRSVAPTLQDETNAVVSFLKSRGRTGIALYSAYGDVYSADLAHLFAQALPQRLLVQDTYTKGSATELQRAANAVASAGADAVYFIGPPDDAGNFMAALHRLNPNVLVIGSDAVYQWVYVYHSGQQRGNFNGLFFAAFAYHSPPGTLNGDTPPMVTLYRQMFNPNKYYVGYFYEQPGSDAILTFDATNLITQAAANVLEMNKKALTTQILWQALVSINSSKGFSGQISFSDINSSFPDQKAVFILSIQPGGNHYEGTFSGHY